MQLRHALFAASWFAGFFLVAPGSGRSCEVVARSGPTCERVDDFADGDALDCEPLCWIVALGQCTPGPDGLECRSDSNAVVGILGTDDVFSGDITVRVRGSFNGTDRPPTPQAIFPQILVSAHFNYDLGATGYNGFVGIGGALRIDKWTKGTSTPLDAGCFEVDPASPNGCVRLDEDWLDIELKVVTVADDQGTRAVIELRVWRPGEARPAAPQLCVVDPSPYVTGRCGAKFLTRGGRPILIRAVSIETPCSQLFRRGDCNDDGKADMSDASFLLNWLFLGGPAPGCIAAANTNGEAGTDLSDATYLLNHLFLGGPPPRAPFPDCGTSTLELDAMLGCDEGSGHCP